MATTHYLAMVVISVGSFIFGILPVTFSFNVQRRYPLCLSLVLCLGAGILLATSIIHMLTEVQEKLKLSAQLYFCIGFLVLYSVDETSHFFLESKKDTPHCHSPNVTETKSLQNKYGSNHFTPTENTPFLDSKPVPACTSKGSGSPDSDSVCNGSKNTLRRNLSLDVSPTCSHSPSGGEDELHCHIEIGKPCSSNPVAKAGLLLALTIHSILEGISIGVQTEFNESICPYIILCITVWMPGSSIAGFFLFYYFPSNRTDRGLVSKSLTLFQGLSTLILLILGTVTFHKVVLAFCLGMELLSYGLKHLYLVSAIFLFSIGSSIGILMGMFITSAQSHINADAQIQAIAAGSLLYVAAFEVLPRERFKWQHRKRRAAGILQLLSVIVGFICVTCLHLFLMPSHGHDPITTESTPRNVTET